MAVANAFPASRLLLPSFPTVIPATHAKAIERYLFPHNAMPQYSIKVCRARTPALQNTVKAIHAHYNAAEEDLDVGPILPRGSSIFTPPTTALHGVRLCLSVRIALQQ